MRGGSLRSGVGNRESPLGNRESGIARAVGWGAVEGVGYGGGCRLSAQGTGRRPPALVGARLRAMRFTGTPIVLLAPTLRRYRCA
ncbi:hypothetical protein XcmpCFBP7700_19460 [Xanthomonas campestris]|nr:hypothetical protein XcmpCFBP7700_19460 [Xanthomonas campestris]